MKDLLNQSQLLLWVGSALPLCVVPIFEKCVRHLCGRPQMTRTQAAQTGSIKSALNNSRTQSSILIFLLFNSRLSRRLQVSLFLGQAIGCFSRPAPFSSPSVNRHHWRFLLHPPSPRPPPPLPWEEPILLEPCAAKPSSRRL